MVQRAEDGIRHKMSLYIGNYKISLKKPCNIGRQLYYTGPLTMAQSTNGFQIICRFRIADEASHRKNFEQFGRGTC